MTEGVRVGCFDWVRVSVSSYVSPGSLGKVVKYIESIQFATDDVSGLLIRRRFS